MKLNTEQAQNYLNSVIVCCEKYYKNDISTIILFGSYARNEAHAHSDVDILILLHNKSKSTRKRIIQNLQYLENHFGYSSKGGNFVENFLIALNYATGMFRSWFVCAEEDFLKNNFSKVIGVNKALSFLLAPSKSIFLNIKKDGVIVYGKKDFLNEYNPIKQSNTSLVKSFLLNTFLSLGGLIISPFTNKSIEYSLEAIKWSIITYKETIKNEKILKLNSIKYFNEYERTRKNWLPNAQLNLMGPYIVYKIHKLAIAEKKLFKTGKQS